MKKRRKVGSADGRMPALCFSNLLTFKPSYLLPALPGALHPAPALTRNQMIVPGQGMCYGSGIKSDPGPQGEEKS